MRARFLLLSLAALMLSVISAQLQAADESAWHYVLSDARTSERVDSFRVTNENLDLPADLPWSISKRLLHGGKQEGVELVVIDNGRLAITVIPTRGMNILEVLRGSFRLGWQSPVKEVVHPSFVDLESRGGLGWLDGFNEWMVRCGLEFAGHPGRDVFTTNTGEQAEMDLTLHGKIGNTPASLVEVLIDRRPPHRLRLRGVVYERMFFGPKLELVTELSTVPGSDAFRIEDAVTNRGGTPQEFQLIYHVNYGAPLLEKGAKLVAALESVAPMNEQAAKGVNDYATYAGPTPGFVEQVYLARPRADAEHRTSVMLQNAAGDRAASLTWNVEELPYLTIWKNTAERADGYVTGLEPATGFPFNRRIERQQGRVPKLAAGQTRHFRLDCSVHLGSDAVQSMAERIAKIAGEKSPKIEHSPPLAKP
jgi:hypothetical protein